MKKIQLHRIALALVGAAGGLAAAAVLPMAVAFADDTIFVPGVDTFDPTQVTGDPPYTPQIETGTELWRLEDLTTHVVSGVTTQGVDTHTEFGSFANDDFAFSGGASIDLTNFGGGFENEFVSIPGSTFFNEPADLLITPFGNFELFGLADVFSQI